MSLQDNAKQSRMIQRILMGLMENNLFLCDFGDDKSCLKNERDEVVFSFGLLEGKTTLEALKIASRRLNKIINEAFKAAQ